MLLFIFKSCIFIFELCTLFLNFSWTMSVISFMYFQFFIALYSHSQDVSLITLCLRISFCWRFLPLPHTFICFTWGLISGFSLKDFKMIGGIFLRYSKWIENYFRCQGSSIFEVCYVWKMLWYLELINVNVVKSWRFLMAVTWGVVIFHFVTSNISDLKITSFCTFVKFFVFILHIVVGMRYKNF